MTDKFELGVTLECKISGFKGIAIGKCSYITGCDQYLVQPPMQEGKYPESTWIDVHRLEQIGKDIIRIDTSIHQGACDPAPKK